MDLSTKLIATALILAGLTLVSASSTVLADGAFASSYAYASTSEVTADIQLEVDEVQEALFDIDIAIERYTGTQCTYPGQSGEEVCLHLPLEVRREMALLADTVIVDLMAHRARADVARTEIATLELELEAAKKRQELQQLLVEMGEVAPIELLDLVGAALGEAHVAIFEFCHDSGEERGEDLEGQPWADLKVCRGHVGMSLVKSND